ncbi:hypothetical protein FOB58_002408 [Candida parapsilosis]|uniref:Uncharacterized protein n=2 Tax=Candida parapsilosis TaxID=5480 RepID=G8B5Z8_CANPC|nr:uncharacterized protein CPAR2_109640 [Candida parapsilosis]KAF6043291.1 hypothetical protein FOB59_005374 [Candida parapsilosis]KAF6049131.1 hypothetical protein FOB58_002408 [Candida parapsilosis]KAF6056982.1 hypothetical protein FOB60_001537 [Candida parapsilosis]KAF6066299.1 hypothetical protein FOB61_002369 [Candida parapsilosis]KAI5902792.1 hypothetical protein K4G60_g1936 [Candida parapsilosis]
MATRIYTPSVHTTSLPSPCESSLTLNPASDIVQQFDSKYLSTYLQNRLAVIKQETENARLRGPIGYLQATEEEDNVEEQEQVDGNGAQEINHAGSSSISKIPSNLQQTEITIIYNHQEITIKLTSIQSLINCYALNKITVDQLTINHLFLYLFYHQLVLFPTRQHQIFIGQFNIIHLGKSYIFQYTNNSSNNNTTTTNPRDRPIDSLLSDLRINQYPKLFLHIRENTMSIGNQKLSLVEIGNFISRIVNFVDKSSGQVTYVDTIKMKLKRSRSSQSNTTIKNNRARADDGDGGADDIDDEKISKRTKIKQELVRVLHRLYF